MAKSDQPVKLDVREACLQKAAEIIASDGVDHLSLREVSRRLSISHQAPYKHFASREALLAEVISRAFDDFTAYLSVRIRNASAEDELPILGRAYLQYAVEHPLEYRLMCETPMPDLERHPGLRDKATAAFSLLLGAISKVRRDEPERVIRSLALFAWSAVHGLASVSANGAMPAIGLAGGEDQTDAVERVLGQICAGVTASKIH